MGNNVWIGLDTLHEDSFQAHPLLWNLSRSTSPRYHSLFSCERFLVFGRFCSQSLSLQHFIPFLKLFIETCLLISVTPHLSATLHWCRTMPNTPWLLLLSHIFKPWCLPDIVCSALWIPKPGTELQYGPPRIKPEQISPEVVSVNIFVFSSFKDTQNGIHILVIVFQVNPEDKEINWKPWK